MKKYLLSSSKGVVTHVTLTLICLKLFGQIDWPWLWIFAPTMTVLAIVTFLFTAMGAYIYSDRKKGKTND